MRLEKGLTQAKLAELTGLTQAYIAKIEAGKADPRFSTLEKLSSVLLRTEEEPLLRAGEMMTSPVLYVRPSDSLEKAIKLMGAKGISQLPVLEEGVQVGSLSEADVVRKVAEGEGKELLKKKVGEVMGGPFPVVGPELPAPAILSMLEHAPAVLVVERGKVKGIVTKADVLRALVERAEAK
ncbi:MAG: CBS domain-containing protein [Candidatus Hadarchaeales archaeon]